MEDGASAEQPYPKVSISSISAAAQLMMTRSLMVELKGQHRVNALVSGPVISRLRPSGRLDWITAVDVGYAVAIEQNIGADAEIHRLNTVADLEKIRRITEDHLRLDVPIRSPDH